MWDDIFIYIPSINQVVRIAEGTGDNLLDEDIEDGWCDYIYYDQYPLEQGMPETDGGMIMTKTLLRDMYSSINECIPLVLRDICDNADVKYVLLNREA